MTAAVAAGQRNARNVTSILDSEFRTMTLASATTMQEMQLKIAMMRFTSSKEIECRFIKIIPLPWHHPLSTTIKATQPRNLRLSTCWLLELFELNTLATMFKLVSRLIYLFPVVVTLDRVAVCHLNLIFSDNFEVLLKIFLRIDQGCANWETRQISRGAPR